MGGSETSGDASGVLNELRSGRSGGLPGATRSQSAVRGVPIDYDPSDSSGTRELAWLSMMLGLIACAWLPHIISKCSHLNIGGNLVWLKYVPFIRFKADNEPFKSSMQGFVQKIVEMMKSDLNPREEQ